MERNLTKQKERFIIQAPTILAQPAQGRSPSRSSSSAWLSYRLGFKQGPVQLVLRDSWNSKIPVQLLQKTSSSMFSMERNCSVFFFVFLTYRTALLLALHIFIQILFSAFFFFGYVQHRGGQATTAATTYHQQKHLQYSHPRKLNSVSQHLVDCNLF